MKRCRERYTRKVVEFFGEANEEKILVGGKQRWVAGQRKE
jgi:hypothetical protein